MDEALCSACTGIRSSLLGVVRFSIDVAVEMAELPEQGALGLGVFEDAGLDGFLFGGGWHGKLF